MSLFVLIQTTNRYRQVVYQNLVSNALKYRSSDAPRIRIRSVGDVEAGEAILVEENGPGILPDGIANRPAEPAIGMTGAEDGATVAERSGHDGQIEVDVIYMIDDSDDEHYLATLFFKRQGVAATLRHCYSFEDFSDLCDGEDGFDPMRSLVVVDLNLWSQTGSDIIAGLRRWPTGDQMITGICTGSEDPADRQTSFDAGADFFIGKPFDRKAVERICLEDDRLEVISGEGEPLRIARRR